MRDAVSYPRVLAFPLPEEPPLYTTEPEKYGTRAWVLSARKERRRMREGLRTGFYKPTPDFMEALEELERVLAKHAEIR